MKALTIMALGTLLYCGSSLQPAFAQGGITIKKDALEKVQWYHAPREFQIINQDPVVRQFPGQGGAGSMNVGNSLPNASGINSNVGTMSGGQGASLPASGFGSNIGPRSMLPKSLPAAKFNNGVAAKMPPPISAPAAAAPRPVQRPMLTHTAAPAPTPTKTYQYQSSGGSSGSTSSQVTTKTIGRLLR